MGERTPIEWCDSSANPVMGCDGCELWNPKTGVLTCYAGILHQVRAGRPGYADTFLVPKLFPGRMAAAARWKDLTGTDRPEKPWLNGLPRMVFISDMGDALSQDVPFDFLRDEIVRVVARWRHVGMWLTKQPQRMVQFARYLEEQGLSWPKNLWAGTSITGQRSLARANQLRKVPAAMRFLSIEPILEDPGAIDFTGIHLAILGGESGPGARPCEMDTMRRLLKGIRAASCAPFVKQLGANVHDRNDAGFDGQEGDAWNFGGEWPPDRVEDNPNGFREEHQGAPVRVRLHDKKGGSMREWPSDLRVREFPAQEIRP